MNLQFTPQEKLFSEEVRDFCSKALPADIRQKQMAGQRLSKQEIVAWQRILNKKGWTAPLWPKEYGGTGWDAVHYFLFKEECYRSFAPDVHSQNISNVGPLIIAIGSDSQKSFFLPKLLNGDVWFCQGFSEPGSGSDLASLKTRAERDGDDYIVNGQKLWTSGAHHADWMYALVRTDPVARKHNGLSYLLIDMQTPGITVRPITSLDGHHHINEVFFDNVRVPISNLLGEENYAWGYAKFLLGNERIGIARVGLTKARIALIKSLAKAVHKDGHALSDDPVFRNKLAAIEVELKALEMTNMMVISNMRKLPAHVQDPRTSILKLKGSELNQLTTEILLEVAGPNSMARQVDFLESKISECIGEPWQATAALNFYIARAVTIYGGTSEVQHNIVSKGVLGL